MRPRLLVASLAALALVLVACGEETEPTASASPPPSASPAPSPSPSPSPTPTGELGPDAEAYLALCAAAASVAAEDLARAEATFHDEVHDALHDLTDRVEEADRTLSAALLQAKSTVEADFAANPPDAEALAAHLAALLTATEGGLAALGVEAPGCPEQPA